eukprot:1148406-Pelagomonas_calceolata.AAC.2
MSVCRCVVSLVGCGVEAAAAVPGMGPPYDTLLAGAAVAAAAAAAPPPPAAAALVVGDCWRAVGHCWPLCGCRCGHYRPVQGTMGGMCAAVCMQHTCNVEAETGAETQSPHCSVPPAAQMGPVRMVLSPLLCAQAVQMGFVRMGHASNFNRREAGSLRFHNLLTKSRPLGLNLDSSSAKGAEAHTYTDIHTALKHQALRACASTQLRTCIAAGARDIFLRQNDTRGRVWGVRCKWRACMAVGRGCAAAGGRGSKGVSDCSHSIWRNDAQQSGRGLLSGGLRKCDSQGKRFRAEKGRTTVTRRMLRGGLCRGLLRRGLRRCDSQKPWRGSCSCRTRANYCGQRIAQKRPVHVRGSHSNCTGNCSRSNGQEKGRASRCRQGTAQKRPAQDETSKPLTLTNPCSNPCSSTHCQECQIQSSIRSL